MSTPQAAPSPSLPGGMSTINSGERPVSSTEEHRSFTYKTKLPSNQEVEIYLRHQEEEITPKRSPIAVSLPGTHLTITLPDGTKAEGRSVCKPPDNFNKREGIKKAFKRAFKGNKILSKEDRGYIFAMLCPKLASKKLTVEFLKEAATSNKLNRLLTGSFNGGYTIGVDEKNLSLILTVDTDKIQSFPRSVQYRRRNIQVQVTKKT